MYASDGIPSKLVPWLIWFPLAMTAVFLTQSEFVVLAVILPLGVLLAYRPFSKSKRRLVDMLSGSFDGEAWLSLVRENIALQAVLFLIFPISVALTLELSVHAVLEFKDSLHALTDLEAIAVSAETLVAKMSSVFTLFAPITFAFFCLCLKPEGATATPRQLLFFVYLIAAFFIFLSGEGWFFERVELMSLKISGKELSDPVAHTLYVVILSIAVLVVFYCYYKISIVLFENLVAKDKKLQFRRWALLLIHGKDPLENDPAIKERRRKMELLGDKMLKQFGAMHKPFGVIERGGLLSVIVTNSACLLAIILYLYI